MKANQPFQYKDALTEIEKIVQQIEQGEPDIDELTAMVKRAAELIKLCKAKLRNTGEELDHLLTELND